MRIYISAQTLHRLKSAAIGEFESDAQPSDAGYTISVAPSTLQMLEILHVGDPDTAITKLLDERDGVVDNRRVM